MKMMRKLGTTLSAVSIVAASCITTAPAVADDENSESAVTLSLVGMVLGFFGLAGIKKSHKEN